MRFRFVQYPQVSQMVQCEIKADDGRLLFQADLTVVEANRLYQEMGSVLGVRRK